jgi:TolB-like protein
MAPEQLRGERADARADLFSLGVVLYELFTGRRPFAGRTPAEVASAILRDAAPPMARKESSTDFEEIVRRCLEKDPALRFQTASEVSRELHRVRSELESRAVSRGRSPSTSAPSIAVLPFTNMSADPENEYFSDGLSEELMNALVKNPALRVTGRTSAFAFKGKNEDLRGIGQKLGVATVLEGSVRKSGDRIRITAQLIDATTGSHIWAERYERDVADIFVIQDEITDSIMTGVATTPARTILPFG